MTTPMPELPAWLITAVNQLPRDQRGVALGFAAAGWVAAHQDTATSEPTAELGGAVGFHTELGPRPEYASAHQIDMRRPA